MYEDKLLEDTVAQPAPNNDDGIPKNTTVAVPLKCLSNFGGHLKCNWLIAKLN